MSKLRYCWKSICRYKIIVALVIFAVTVGFLDENSFWHRYLQEQEISRLRAEIRKYDEMYRADSERLHELNTDPKAVEKVARERYYMRRDNEDVYIFEAQQQDPNETAE